MIIRNKPEEPIRGIAIKHFICRLYLHELSGTGKHAVAVINHICNKENVLLELIQDSHLNVYFIHDESEKDFNRRIKKYWKELEEWEDWYDKNETEIKEEELKRENLKKKNILQRKKSLQKEILKIQRQISELELE